MKLVEADTLADGWLKGCNHLMTIEPDWIDTTLVIHVATPTVVRVEDQAVAATLDAFLAAHEQFSNHTVAETIFPGYEYVRRGVAGVYTGYPDEVYPKVEPEVGRWGTYAQRLLRRTDRDGRTYNPLEECIVKMRDKVPKWACYELGLGFDLATYDDDEDRTSRMGGPCLSHLSFKVIAKRVHLTALYRSHYYVHRAYGNLLGLARLQSFVADQIGAKPGPLVCHSTLARLEDAGRGDARWTKNDLCELLERCNLLMRGDADGADASSAAAS